MIDEKGNCITSWERLLPNQICKDPSVPIESNTVWRMRTHQIPDSSIFSSFNLFSENNLFACGLKPSDCLISISFLNFSSTNAYILYVFLCLSWNRYHFTWPLGLKGTERAESRESKCKLLFACKTIISCIITSDTSNTWGSIINLMW